MKMKILNTINSKIRNKLIFGFVFISLIAGVVSYISVITIQQIENNYSLISTKSLPFIQSLKDMKFECLRLISSASEYAYIQTESNEKQEATSLDQENDLIQQSCRSCHEAFSHYKRLVEESFPELIENSKDIRNFGNKVRIDAVEFIEMKKMHISGTEALEKKKLMETNEMGLLKALNYAIDYTNTKLEKEKAQLVNTISLSRRNILVIAGLTILISLLLGTVYSHSISKPIIELTQLTKDFGEGILDAKIEVKSFDEIGTLANAFNNMAIALKTSANKLQIEKERFQQLYDSSPIGIVLLTKYNKIIQVNQAFQTIFKYTAEEIIGIDINTLLVPPEFLDEAVSLTKDAIRGIANKETIRKQKDGSLINVHVYGIPLSYGGEIVGLYGLYEDITKRVRSEESLRESEDRFRNFVENISDVFFIADENGKLVYCSPNFFNLTDFLPQDVYGRSYIRFVAPVDRKKILEFYTEQVKSNVSDAKLDFRAIFKNGKLLWVEQNTRFVRDANGKVIQYRIVVRDISERKHAEEDLQNQRLLLRTVIDNIPDSIYCKDLNCRKTLANLTELQYAGAKSEKEILGMTDFDLYPKEMAEKFFADDQSVIRTNQPVLNREEYIIDANEHRQCLLTSKIPLKDEKGNITGIVGIGRNITDRKLAEEEISERNEQLVKLNAEKDKFFSIIAHDLKSPFLGFLGLTEVMASEDEELSRDELRNYSRSIHKSASALFALIENLLEWARMQRGLIIYTPKEIELQKIANDCIEIAADRAVQKGITVINKIPESQRVFADDHMIRTIFRNLLTNAIKFTGRGGKVVLQSKKTESSMIEVSVSDTGIGMTQEDVAKLFKIEGKTSSKGTDGETSTGLGLLLCKEFVEKHDGKIWVESQVEKGSTFTFNLPYANS